MKAKHKSLIGTALTIAMVIGCGSWIIWIIGDLGEKMMLPPTQQTIKNNPYLRPFLIRSSEFQGNYGNADIDAGIFSYRTEHSGGFWPNLTRGLSTTEWLEVGLKDGSRRYRHKESLEVRVMLFEATQIVVVAYVYGHQPDSEWMNRHLWSRMKNIRTEQADGPLVNP